MRIPASSPENGSQNRPQGSTGSQDDINVTEASGLLEGGSGARKEHPVNPPTQENSLAKKGNDHVNLRLRRCTAEPAAATKQMYRLGSGAQKQKHLLASTGCCKSPWTFELRFMSRFREVYGRFKEV